MVEELVSLHDVQAYHQTPCQNSRCQFGGLPLRGVCLSGIGRLAAQPSLREARLASVSTRRAGRLRIAGSVLEEPSERIRGKRAFCGRVRS